MTFKYNMRQRDEIDHNLYTQERLIELLIDTVGDEEPDCSMSATDFARKFERLNWLAAELHIKHKEVKQHLAGHERAKRIRRPSSAPHIPNRNIVPHITDPIPVN